MKAPCSEQGEGDQRGTEGDGGRRRAMILSSDSAGGEITRMKMDGNANGGRGG